MVAIYEIRVSKNRNFACSLAAYVCMTEVEIYGKMLERSTVATTKWILTKDKIENKRSVKKIKVKENPKSTDRPI